MHDARLAILVPTLGRHERLESLMRSIHECTRETHHVYVMVEPKDTATCETVRAFDDDDRVTVHVGEYGSYVNSTNFGFHVSTELFVFAAADDVVFTPGWDVKAFEVMRRPIRVVGIDQGNGRQDCFFLVDRRYIVRYGTIDEPGQFYHPGYVSQYCDTEFVDTAKMRGVWSDSKAKIEHQHWTLGKSSMDDTYRIAVDNTAADRGLYWSRMRLWAA